MLPGYLVFFLTSWLTAMNEWFLILNHWIIQLDPSWVESINKFEERIGGVWDTQKQRKYIHSLRCHVGLWPSASGALWKLIKTTSHCDPNLPPPRKNNNSSSFCYIPLHFPYFKPSLALAKPFQTFHWIIENPSRSKRQKKCASSAAHLSRHWPKWSQKPRVFSWGALSAKRGNFCAKQNHPWIRVVHPSIPLNPKEFPPQ